MCPDVIRSISVYYSTSALVIFLMWVVLRRTQITWWCLTHFLLTFCQIHIITDQSLCYEGVNVSRSHYDISRSLYRRYSWGWDINWVIFDWESSLFEFWYYIYIYLCTPHMIVCNCWREVFVPRWQKCEVHVITLCLYSYPWLHRYVACIIHNSQGADTFHSKQTYTDYTSLSAVHRLTTVFYLKRTHIYMLPLVILSNSRYNLYDVGT